MPTFKDRVISIIGAADAATAGFIAAQLRGEKVETAVLWGATCASACIKVSSLTNHNLFFIFILLSLLLLLQ